jgi:DNA-binding CsgD family transcriptional regulator
VSRGPPPDARVVYFQVGAQRYAILSHQARAGASGTLTEAERAVIQLALDGLSNARIAEERGTSTRTVRNQLVSAYGKLGVGSRSELAAWITREPPR